MEDLGAMGIMWMDALEDSDVSELVAQRTLALAELLVEGDELDDEEGARYWMLDERGAGLELDDLEDHSLEDYVLPISNEAVRAMRARAQQWDEHGALDGEEHEDDDPDRFYHPDLLNELDFMLMATDENGVPYLHEDGLSRDSPSEAVLARRGCLECARRAALCFLWAWEQHGVASQLPRELAEMVARQVYASGRDRDVWERTRELQRAMELVREAGFKIV